jgi:hypothetical protein
VILRKRITCRPRKPFGRNRSVPGQKFSPLRVSSITTRNIGNLKELLQKRGLSGLQSEITSSTASCCLPYPNTPGQYFLASTTINHSSKLMSATQEMFQETFENLQKAFARRPFCLLLRSTANLEYQTGWGYASGLPKYFGDSGERLWIVMVGGVFGGLGGVDRSRWSRLFSARRGKGVGDGFGWRTLCRDESRHGTHECVRHVGCGSGTCTTWWAGLWLGSFWGASGALILVGLDFVFRSRGSVEEQLGIRRSAPAARHLVLHQYWWAEGPSGRRSLPAVAALKRRRLAVGIACSDGLA